MSDSKLLDWGYRCPQCGTDFSDAVPLSDAVAQWRAAAPASTTEGSGAGVVVCAEIALWDAEIARIKDPKGRRDMADALRRVIAARGLVAEALNVGRDAALSAPRAEPDIDALMLQLRDRLSLEVGWAVSHRDVTRGEQLADIAIAIDKALAARSASPTTEPT